MQIDLIYINDELQVNISGIINTKDIYEIERRVNLILKSYPINNIRYKIKKNTYIEDLECCKSLIPQ